MVVEWLLVSSELVDYMLKSSWLIVVEYIHDGRIWWLVDSALVRVTNH